LNVALNQAKALGDAMNVGRAPIDPVNALQPAAELFN
jgi:hypothetical protein